MCNQYDAVCLGCTSVLQADDPSSYVRYLPCGLVCTGQDWKLDNPLFDRVVVDGIDLVNGIIR